MPGNERRPTGPRWGWHRLDPAWADRLVDAAGVRAGELVLDLGAGTGALTRPLSETGARIIAIELHHRRAAQLRSRGAGWDSVRVVEADVLTVPLPNRPYRVVANPPYAVSALTVRRLTGRASRLVAADLLLQRAVVNRWVADPPRGFSAALGLRIPRSAFSPRPQVDSAVLVLRRH